MKEKDETTYRFFNPNGELFSHIIKKKGIYEYDGRKNQEIRKDWYYYSDKTIKNPALIFSKLIPYPTDSRDENINKDKYLQLVIEEIEKIDQSKILKNLGNRQKKTIKGFAQQGYVVSPPFSSTLSWRMVIGLGASHPQETSMTLHHIYGIPYIPGSAVKGVTRHWVILEEFDKLELPIEQIKCFEKILENADLSKDDKISRGEFEEKFKDRRTRPDEKLFNFFKDQQKFINLFQDTFGTQNHIGKVIFFDAYPVGEIKLKIDVMTPHYPKYYSDAEPPADWQSPTPIKFLTVEKTKFEFFLASKVNELLNKTYGWLKEALENYGIGAKTSLGYGVFE